jgi:anaerobic ribonucleoside-triphosphate reductase
LDGDEQRQLEMLKTRLELHNEVYNARLKREQKAKQRAGLIKRYIGT